MSKQYRKLLIVKHDPPKHGYVAMFELNDRTRSLQLTDHDGDQVMQAAIDKLLELIVLKGGRRQ